MLTFFTAYLLCGIIIGLCAGVFGIGGGLFGIPALCMLFTRQGMPPALAMHMAIGTLLATVIITSLTSINAHYKKGMIVFSLCRQFVPGAILGSLMGMMLSQHINGLYLQKLFGFFLLMMALQFCIFPGVEHQRPLPSGNYIFMTAIVFGLLSSLLGLGGGVLMVPYFNWHGLSMRHAVATASACILPIALVGAVGYMMSDTTLYHLPPLNSGFIYWPAFIGISLTSLVFAPLGVRVAHGISPLALKRIFALILLMASTMMLI